jgi:hypothetical protein
MLNNQMVPISSVPVAFHRPWPYFKPGAFWEIHRLAAGRKRCKPCAGVAKRCRHRMPQNELKKKGKWWNKLGSSQFSGKIPLFVLWDLDRDCFFLAECCQLRTRWAHKKHQASTEMNIN